MAKEKINYYILFIFMLLSPIVDILNSFIQHFFNTSISLGMLYKGLLLFYLLYYFLFKIKDLKNKKYLIIYGIMVLIWLLLFLGNRFSMLSFINIYKELIYVFKIFYLPVMLYLLYYFIKDNNMSVKDIEKILIISFLVYVLLLFVPYITDTAFYSYGDKSLGGFVGWFYAANEVSIMMILLFYVTLKEAYNYKKIFFIPLLLGIFMILQIGTKVTLLGLSLTFLFFLGKSLFKLEWKNALYTLILILGAILITCNGFMGNNMEVLVSNGEEIVENEEYEEAPVNNRIEMLLNLVLSSRYTYFKDTLDIYNKANLKDKIIGIGYTNNEIIDNVKIEKLIEIDLLDIYFHIGLIGFILFLVPLLVMAFNILKEIIKNKLFNFNILSFLYIILVALGISLTAGHMLSAPSVSIIFAFYIILLGIEVDCFGRKYENVVKKDYK